MPTNYRQVYAIQKKNRERILKICPDMDNKSGIYFYTREDEDGIKYSYCGLAEHLLDRQISHLSGFQWIDISIKSHGLYDENNNPYGWKLGFKHFPKDQLEEKERYYITLYAKAGYQSRNKDTGGGSGKRKINEYKQPKTYRQGIQAGYIKASKEISILFEKYLNYSTKDKVPNRYQLNALDKFQTFLDFHKQEQDKTE